MKKTKNTCLDENISIIILIIILLGLVLLAGTMNEKIVEGIPGTKYNLKLVLKNDTAGYIK
tara:strand:+ start:457 stop:639 length:183 start_codon:yes stop_codon:yes gene_type:complete